MFTSCQPAISEPEAEPVIMSPTASRLMCIQSCFDRYHEALNSKAERNHLTQAEDRVMGIIRHAWASDWLTVMEYELNHGEWGIDKLIDLITIRVLKARAVGDDGYDVALIIAYSEIRNETQAQIVQQIHESIFLSID